MHTNRELGVVCERGASSGVPGSLAQHVLCLYATLPHRANVGRVLVVQHLPELPRVGLQLPHCGGSAGTAWASVCQWAVTDTARVPKLLPVELLVEHQHS